MSDVEIKPKGVIVYQSPHISARSVALGSERVVVSFPDRIHPLGPNHAGWGEGFLTKRGISGIYIALTDANWFQCPDFFEAMRACRDFLGPDVQITSYGSSMGGYGAILAAKTLKASLCVALSPQFSIDPKVVPFERRYLDYAKVTGPFLHDVTAEVDQSCDYVIAYDPLHGRDRRHVSILSQCFHCVELPVYCGGHGILNLLKQADGLNSVADLLVGKARAGDIRHHIRGNRRTFYRYLKKMGQRAKERGHEDLFDYESAMHNQENKTVEIEISRPTVDDTQQPKLVIHCGLPKTGTSSLQAYFYNHAERYRAYGVFYPTENINKHDLNHAWFSRELRDASVDQLIDTLANIPEGTETVLFSDESLFVEFPGLTESAHEALSVVLGGYDVKLVICERNKTAWMRSFYLQSVQNRRSGRKTQNETARNLWQTPLEYEAFFAQPFCQKLLDFDAMRTELSQAFAATSLTVIAFEPGKDIVQTFCTAMGWPYMGNGPELMLNPSITDSEVEILRQANTSGNDVGRFIKQMIELPLNFDAAGIRAKRRETLLGQAKEFPWDLFEFRANQPLAITPESFQDALETLRAKAARLGA